MLSEDQVLQKGDYGQGIRSILCVTILRCGEEVGLPGKQGVANPPQTLRLNDVFYIKNYFANNS